MHDLTKVAEGTQDLHFQFYFHSSVHYFIYLSIYLLICLLQHKDVHVIQTKITAATGPKHAALRSLGALWLFTFWRDYQSSFSKVAR